MAPNKRRFCPHCKENVSVRTYQRHFDLYFDKEKDKWRQRESSDEDDCLVQIDSPSDLFEKTATAMCEPDVYGGTGGEANSEACKQTGSTQGKS